MPLNSIYSLRKEITLINQKETNMSKSRKKTQRQSVYGETVTSLNTNYQINQHLGIETIHEEEQKMTNINNNNNHIEKP